MVSPSLARRPNWGVAAVLSLLLELATCQTSTFKFDSTPTNFQGFYVANPTSVEQINCATTRTWTTSGSFGACCVSGQTCTYYTHCQGGTVTRMDGSFWTWFVPLLIRTPESNPTDAITKTAPQTSPTASP